MQIKGSFGDKFKVYTAITQRLMYTFAFTQEQAWAELKILILNGNLVQEEYYLKVSRIGRDKALTRKARMHIWKHCKAIVDEANKEV